ncbi:MAG: dicarboxylate/amino acid:cation symporter [Thermodesulfobacteria bacterium]|nr:dicarboxylate/amino acid:cation symporter [Thermodesulfobacteriota bacterium]
MKKFFSVENLTFVAIVLGVLCGVYLSKVALSVYILGKVFLRLLKLIIVPLVLTSVFVAVISLEDVRKVKDLGVKTLFYYLITTAFSVILGLALVTVIQPGKHYHLALATKRIAPHLKHFKLSDIVWSIIPSNIFNSFSKGKVLQIIFFSIILGLATIAVPKEKTRSLTNFFNNLNDVLLKFTQWIIALTPIGVFSLVSYTVAKAGLGIFVVLAKYAFTVILGLFIHAFITLALIGWIIGKYNPYSYFLKVREALLLAFSTASSAATLPVTLKVAEEKGRVKKEVAGFVLPLGATINMDGTALYEAVAAVFIANIYGIKLSFLQLVIIFLTATLASIGAAAIPGAGMVMLTLVLSSVGIPLEGIGIILTIDRFLDMLRTAVNVWGDLNGAKIINRFIKI